tara:strand:- start:315 stop:470 length:156 start_codon:yes stop_codon:yes gene_type:complete
MREHYKIERRANAAFDFLCATCQLCQRQRSVIVGFPAHGSRHRTINLRLAA